MVGGVHNHFKRKGTRGRKPVIRDEEDDDDNV
jgi:hypothetical protein